MDATLGKSDVGECSLKKNGCDSKENEAVIQMI
jgi:hypothetical protein